MCVYVCVFPLIAGHGRKRVYILLSCALGCGSGDDDERAFWRPCAVFFYRFTAGRVSARPSGSSCPKLKRAAATVRTSSGGRRRALSVCGTLCSSVYQVTNTEAVATDDHRSTTPRPSHLNILYGLYTYRFPKNRISSRVLRPIWFYCLAATTLHYVDHQECHSPSIFYHRKLFSLCPWPPFYPCHDLFRQNEPLVLLSCLNCRLQYNAHTSVMQYNKSEFKWNYDELFAPIPPQLNFALLFIVAIKYKV